MRRGIKRAVVTAAAAGITSMVFPATAALATSADPNCASGDVVITTALNFRHCYKSNGTLKTTINSVVLFQAGNNSTDVWLNSSGTVQVLLTPGASKRWSAPGVTIYAVQIFN